MSNSQLSYTPPQKGILQSKTQAQSEFSRNEVNLDPRKIGQFWLRKIIRHKKTIT